MTTRSNNHNPMINSSHPLCLSEDGLTELLTLCRREQCDIYAAAEMLRAEAEAIEAQYFGSVAVVPLMGVYMTRLSTGGRFLGRESSAYSGFVNDVEEAIKNGAKTVIINAACPGGVTSFLPQAADAIYQLRDKAKIIAYISVQACSAGYWLSSAAHEIVISESGFAGSIGTKMFTFTRWDDEVVVVSDQSPEKDPDPATEDGQAQLRKPLNQITEVFIEKVAQYRNVTKEKVLSDFGKGNYLVGKFAVEAGLADRVGTLEELIQTYSDNNHPDVGATNDTEEIIMSESNTPASQPDNTQDQIKAAMERAQSILNCDEAQGRETMASHLAFKTEMSLEQAKEMLSMAPSAKTNAENTDLSHLMDQEGDEDIDGNGGGERTVTQAPIDIDGIYNARQQTVERFL